MNQRPAHRVALLGVSIPRSGHHFLARLLEEVFGSDISYCEYYSQDGCCRQTPCIRGRRSLVTYQKNHDLDLTLDRHLPDVSYLVQFREPVPAIVSDRELFSAVRGRRLADDRSQYLAFLAEKAAHYTKFYDKWVRRPGPDVFLVPYERLLAEPGAIVTELLRFCALPVASDRIAAAVATVTPILQRTPLLKETAEVPFSPRVIARSRYFDPQLLAAYESLVLDRVPELSASRVFPRVDHANHPLLGLFNVHCASVDGRPATVVELATNALTLWPDLPHLHHMAGNALRTLGRHDAALPYLEAAVRLAPDDADLIVSCANGHVALQHFDRAAELAAGIVAVQPEDASHRLFLATILVMAGRTGEALQQALHALNLGIVGPHLWQAFGSIVQHARKEHWTLHAVAADAP